MSAIPSSASLVERVIDAYARTDDPRLNQVLGSLVRHLHAFAREVKLTPEEWLAGVQFLTATGQMCTEKRQEFILLSDALGLSTAIDEINHQASPGLTETAVLGPFYSDGSPWIENGASIALAGKGERTLVRGRVLDETGQKIGGAVIDIWQAAPNKLYAVQDAEQPEMNLRGKLRTRDDGSFAFLTFKPPAYPVPTDGPVGRLLNAVGRDPMRPAHVHFIIEAPGFQRLTTQLFTHDDPYIDSDAVFGVKPSLLVKYQRPTNRAAGYDWLLEHDFVLKRA